MSGSFQDRENIFGSIAGVLENGKDPAATGLMVLIPILVTAVAINWLFELVANIPGTAILEITPFFHVNQTIKLLVLSVTGGFFITSLGNFMETKKGFRAEKAIDSLFNRIPVMRSVYKASKITAETVLGGSEDLGKPVKIDMGKMKVTGFKTGNKTPDGKNLVFIPTSPNITSGFVVEMEDRWIQGTEETMTDALTKVLSAGFGTQDHPANHIQVKQEQL